MRNTATDGWCDFNDIDENGVVIVIAQHWDRDPEFLMPCVVGDGEGNVCSGVVVGVEPRFTRVRLHLNTFRNIDE